MKFFKHLSKIFLLFFFLAQAGTLKAQTYQPMAVDSTLWLNYLYYFEQTPQGGVSHRDTAFFVINGDTLANGKLWKKFKLWTHYIFPEFNGLIRDDISNRKVWFKMLPPFTLDTTEILLYDFNVQVGDTFYIEGWVLDTMTNGNPSPNAMMSEWYTSNYLFMRKTHMNVVTQVDSVQLLDGNWYRRLIASDPQAGVYPISYIESIGAINHPLIYHFAKNIFDFTMFPSCKFNKKNNLVFRQNCMDTFRIFECDELTPGNYYLCDGLVNLDEKLNPNAEIQVYPNPNDGSFRVKHGSGFNELQIYDTQGNSMFYQKINGIETSVKLKLSAGTYTLRLSGRLGEKFHKIIIQ